MLGICWHTIHGTKAGIPHPPGWLCNGESQPAHSLGHEDTHPAVSTSGITP